MGNRRAVVDPGVGNTLLAVDPPWGKGGAGDPEAWDALAPVQVFVAYPQPLVAPHTVQA